MTNGFWNDVVPRLDPDRCRRCADCPPAAACSSGAIRQPVPNRLPVIDEGFCFGCYACAAACPHKAIILPRHRKWRWK